MTTKLAEELLSLRWGLPGAAADDDFVARVMDACADAREAPKSQPNRRAFGVGAALAAAACLALGVGLWPRAPAETITARGVVPEGLRATVQAFVGRAAPGSAPALLEGARLGPGDGILVRYSNHSTAAVYLMVFALDERGSVHWLHPAYLNESTNPTSLELARNVTHRVLPEVAEPEDAAAGALRVYALLSPRALDVKSVENELGAANPDVSALFPEAEVEEWRCTWAP